MHAVNNRLHYFVPHFSTLTRISRYQGAQRTTRPPGDNAARITLPPHIKTLDTSSVVFVSCGMQRPAHAARDHVRWVLVGTGEFAIEWIAPALQRAAQCQLVGVVSRSMGRARQAAAQLGVPLAYTAIDDIDLNEVLLSRRTRPLFSVT